MAIHSLAFAAGNCCLLAAVAVSTACAGESFRSPVQEAPRTIAAENPRGSARDANLPSPKALGEARELAGESIFGEGRIPKLEGARLQLPSLVVPTTQVRGIGNGQTPKDNADLAMTRTIALPEGYDRRGDWMQSALHWEASNTFSHPLYFQDVMLERHGHECAHCLQPAVSAARFFTTLPALPYLMTVQRPCELNHTLGYYRPGSRAPNLLQRPPYQRDAVINQAAWLTGAILIFP